MIYTRFLREHSLLEAVLNLLRNNIIIAGRYVPAILRPCLASWIPWFLSIARYWLPISDSNLLQH